MKTRLENARAVKYQLSNKVLCLLRINGAICFMSFSFMMNAYLFQSLNLIKLCVRSPPVGRIWVRAQWSKIYSKALKYDDDKFCR